MEDLKRILVAHQLKKEISSAAKKRTRTTSRSVKIARLPLASSRVCRPRDFSYSLPTLGVYLRHVAAVCNGALLSEQKVAPSPSRAGRVVQAWLALFGHDPISLCASGVAHHISAWHLV